MISRSTIMKQPLKYLRIVILSFVLMLVSITATAQTHPYLERNKAIASEFSARYGIPVSVILSVAFVESGAGTSKSSTQFNNHFGIVGKNNPESRYRSFSSVRECYEAFCKLIVNKDYYTALKGNTDLSKWVKAIASAGYSTRPKEWMRRINLIISRYSLSKL